MADEAIVTQTEVAQTTSSNGVSSPSMDFDWDAFIDSLISEIPNTTKVDIPKESPAEKKIQSFNEEAEKAIINAYTKSENNRLSHQKPIMVAIIILLVLQLCAFNTLMFILLYKSFSVILTDSNLFVELLNFLKYYIGAVIVELIGLMLVITKNTFSLHSGKAIEKIIASKNR